VEVFGTGKLDITGHAAPGVAVGSIEGDGNIALGTNRLTVGANNLNTTFSGHVQNNLGSGSLGKTGTGTLELTTANNFGA
jgi:fibronectin-binding autotransporter adhesin